MKRLNGLIMGALMLTSTLVSAVESQNFTPTSENLYVATTGEVFVTFLSKTAAYSNDLFLVGSSNLILNNQTAEIGSTYSLGSFQAGTELIFKIVVNGLTDVFYNGDGSRNFDEIEHAAYQQQGNLIIVGFEDIAFGGDRDYDDLVFSVSNTRVGVTSPVPEPEMAAMLMAGLGLMGFAKRRKR